MENIFLMLELPGNVGEHLGPGSDGGELVSTTYEERASRYQSGQKSSMKKERGGETRKIFCSSSNCLAPNEEIRN